MSSSPYFSIIIPFKDWSPYLDECLLHIGKLSFRDYEVILLPDGDIEIPDRFRQTALRVIPTAEVNPAVKRDLGARESLGQVLAFIDDDAYPRPDWLDVARRAFEKNGFSALGGPGITPREDPFWARVSGAVFLSRTSGGFPERYVSYPPGKLVDDWPTVNLLIKKDLFLSVGGFDSAYWPGEDTEFCLKLLNATNQKILYVPNLVVWHHRRPGLRKHLRQVGNYGLHRGFFAKKFPETSRRAKYFVPTAWVGFVIFGLFLSGLSPLMRELFVTGWLAYGIALLLSLRDILRHEPLPVALGALPFILLTHLWYGVRFAMGLCIKNLQSSLGR